VRLAKLSVVIPAHDEEACIESTVRELAGELARAGLAHEILVVDDHSSDRTAAVLAALARELPELRVVPNENPPGFGFAVRSGLERASGDAVAIAMADASDRPADLVRFVRCLEETGVDCVFGTRWSRDSRVVDYPLPKRLANRIANHAIRILFGFRYDDVTNAFKLYRGEVVEGLRPFLSHHFNLTVELPLKAIVRGYRYAVVPHDWVGRRAGQSKLRLKEMGSRYLFIVLYCLIEKWLSAGDYRRRELPAASPAEPGPGSPVDP
jgi:dolichol-phosphate mannosyltransferase